jgi:hypothetical protein
MDKKFAKEKANDITATGKAVGFPANLKVYTGGKAPGVDKWLVYARAFDGSEETMEHWNYLEDDIQVAQFLKELD